jgi:hypothetical protein
MQPIPTLYTTIILKMLRISCSCVEPHMVELVPKIHLCIAVLQYNTEIPTLQDGTKGWRSTGKIALICGW